MKVWLLLTPKGNVIGVYKHMADAYEDMQPGDTLEEWEVK